MDFYTTLERVMQKKGITAAELARRTGFHRSYFSELKQGRMKGVSWDKALLIIAALEMTPSEFADEYEHGEDDNVQIINFYETLDLLMEQRGISAAQLSRLTGIRSPYFSDLKHGRAKDVTWANANKIFAALEISPNEFSREQGYRYFE